MHTSTPASPNHLQQVDASKLQQEEDGGDAAQRDRRPLGVAPQQQLLLQLNKWWSVHSACVSCGVAAASHCRGVRLSGQRGEASRRLRGAASLELPEGRRVA